MENKRRPNQKHQFLLLYMSVLGLLMFGFVIIFLSVFGIPRQRAAVDKNAAKPSKVAEIFQQTTGDAVFNFIPADTSYSVNQPSSFGVEMDTQGQDVVAADLVLRYDSSKIKVENSGIVLGNIFDQIDVKEVYPSQGIIEIKQSFLSHLTSYKGVGTLATINFTPLTTGTSDISLECQESGIYYGSSNLLLCSNEKITVNLAVCNPDCSRNTTTCAGTTYSDGCGGTCTGTASVCVRGDTKCSGSQVQLCNSSCTGWEAATNCPISGQTCTNNTCADVGCTPNCSCAANTCTGTNCSNSCGGTCPGTKSCCLVNCSCAANTCSGSTCSNGCGGTCQGTKNCGISCEKENPARPTNLKAVTGTESGTVKLTWTKSTSTATHYSISYGEKWLDFSYGSSNIGNTDQYLVRGLRPGVLYYFAVAAVNDCASSGISEGSNAYAGKSTTAAGDSGKIVRTTPRPTVKATARVTPKVSPSLEIPPQASSSASSDEWEDKSPIYPDDEEDSIGKGSIFLQIATVLPWIGLAVLLIFGIMLVRFIRGEGDDRMSRLNTDFDAYGEIKNGTGGVVQTNKSSEKDPLAPPFK
jgi:hypothetical protein